jgi:hypothetical protein
MKEQLRSKRGRKPNPDNIPSLYFLFHMTFFGYSFLDKKTNTIKSKSQIFHRCQETAKIMIQEEKPSVRYKLVNSIGFRNGLRSSY